MVPSGLEGRLFTVSSLLQFDGFAYFNVNQRALRFHSEFPDEPELLDFIFVFICIIFAGLASGLTQVDVGYLNLH